MSLSMAAKFCIETCAVEGWQTWSSERQIEWGINMLKKYDARVQPLSNGAHLYGQRLLFKDGSAVENFFSNPHVWHALVPEQKWLREYRQ